VSGFSFSHLSGPQVLHGFSQAKASSRATEALLLAYVADIDARKLFLDAGYPSIHAFCVTEFDATHDEAKGRIRTARVALKFPAMFAMLSDGRLQMSVVLLLAPYLHPGNVDELLAAVTNKSKREVQRILAQRFPRTELMSWTMGSPSPGHGVADAIDQLGIAEPLTVATPSLDAGSTTPEQKCETVGVPERLGMTTPQPAPESHAIPTPTPQVMPDVTPIIAIPTTTTSTSTIHTSTIPATSIPNPPQTRVTPIAANAHGVQFMMDDDAHDDLEYLRAALGHEAPTDAHVFARALKALRREVDRRRSAATDRPQRPRPQPKANPNPRHIPNHVRRAVWKRDRSQCAFLSTDGRRCSARGGLELDHIVPIARGGQSTVDNLRLLCWAHNQFVAEQTLGSAFMKSKRDNAKRKRAGIRPLTH
jgi:5-methylcytosine-specific restriction endonuclease McrA